MLALSLIALLQIAPAEADKIGGVQVSYGRLASVAVWCNWRMEEHENRYSQHDRYAIQLFPFADPRWRDRDCVTISTGRRLDITIESNLFRLADKGGFEIREMVSTNYVLMPPLLPYIPPLDCP